MKQTLLATFIVLTALFDTSVWGQNPKHESVTNETCVGPVYSRKEVSRPAEFKRPIVGMTKEALAAGRKARVTLSAVFCHTGRVTDIEVSQGSPDGMTESVVEAIRLIKFTPAEKDGRAVSQVVKFDFRFGFIGERRPLAQGPLEGRRIDLVEVGGYRKELEDDMQNFMKLSGQLYNKVQIELAWRMLLESGDFDPEASVLRIEERDLGGLALVVELKQKTKH